MSASLSSTRSARRLLAPVAAVFLCWASTAQAICYVNAANGAAPTKDGTSWPTAYVDLQNALANAACTQVWVAKGVYKPTSGTDRTIGFAVKAGAAIYGGFAGTEALLGDRNVGTNPTVLSGDIDSNDTGSGGIDGDVSMIVGSNSYHVVTMVGTTTAVGPGTILDGFTITGGNADSATGMTDPNGIGGGFTCDGTVGGTCSPTLRNLRFTGNSAAHYGGAMFNAGAAGTSSPTVSDSVFSGNHAGSDGGAMFNYGESGGHSSPSVSNVTFSNNSAQFGGAVFNDGNNSGNSSPTFTGVTFSANNAISDGGAVFNDSLTNGTCNPVFANVTFGGNHADGTTTGVAVPPDGGGAIFNDGRAGGHVTPTFSNVTFGGNSAGGIAGGGAIINSGANGTAQMTMHNVILWGDTIAAGSGIEILNYAPTGVASAAIDHSIVQGGCPAGATCAATTLFTDPLLGPLANNGGATQTFLPNAGGPAFDAGDDTVCATAAAAVDQRGVLRPQGVHCDVGAVEIGIYALQINVVLNNGATGTVSAASPPAAQSGAISACSSTCSATYIEQSVVQLTASPAAGSFFSGWSGACTGSAVSSVSMLSALSCTATFGRITIAPASLPDATVAIPYAPLFLTSTGGTPVYAYAVTAGALPPGVNLDASGTLSGTPTAGGTFAFTVTSTDLNGLVGKQTFSLVVAPPTIFLSSSLPNAAAESPYAQAIAALGGTAPYAFSVSAGTLPAGLGLSPSGVLSGTPTASGNFTFTVMALDSSTGTGPFAGSQTYSLLVAAPTLGIAPATLLNGTIGSGYAATLTGNGGVPPYAFSITAGALPTGVALAGNGTLSGTPTTSGVFSFTIAASDSLQFGASRAYIVSIAKTPSSLALTSSPNPSQQGQWVNFSISVSAAAPSGNAAGAVIAAAGANGSTTAAPTGTVTLTDGVATLGTVALVNGTATTALAFTAPGDHSITAAYSGDATTAAASATIVQAVAGVSAPVPAPTLSAWLMSLLAGLIGAAGSAHALRSRPQRARR